jgi:hypothetical protein
MGVHPEQYYGFIEKCERVGKQYQFIFDAFVSNDFLRVIDLPKELSIVDVGSTMFYLNIRHLFRRHWMWSVR